MSDATNNVAFPWNNGLTHDKCIFAAVLTISQRLANVKRALRDEGMIILLKCKVNTIVFMDEIENALTEL